MAKSMEELLKAARPALRYAELVQLARTKSPNKVVELARARGDKPRAVKAARYLAILRRDHGDEAFERVVSNHTELARSGEPDTEHARWEKKRMEHRLETMLKSIKNPKDRILLIHRQGSPGRLSREIVGMLKEQPVVLIKVGRQDSVEDAILYLDDANSELYGLVLRVFPEDSDPAEHQFCHNSFDIHVLGLYAALDGDVVDAMVILRDLVKAWDTLPSASRFADKAWEGTRVVADLLAESHLELADRKGLERAYWLWRFRQDEHSRLACVELGYDPLDRGGRTEQLNGLVDKLEELGMSRGEIQVEFTALLDRKKRPQPEVLLPVVGSKAFDSMDRADRRLRSKVVLDSMERVLPDMLLHGVNRWSYFKKLLSYLEWEDREYIDKSWVFDLLAAELAKGRAAFIVDFLEYFQQDLGLKERTSRKGPDVMLILAARAFPIAYENGEFGIAAAMVQHFGAQACVDEERIKREVNLRFRERVQLAMDREYINDDYLYELLELSESVGAVKNIIDVRDAELHTAIGELKEKANSVTQLALALGKSVCLDFAERIKFKKD